MDIPRSPQPRRVRLVGIGLAAVIAAIATVVLASRPNAAPSIDRSIIQIATVERGVMVRTVRAPGVLAPEAVRYVAALTAGRVERLAVRPGEPVPTDGVLLEISNPDVELQALEARRQVTSAEAALVQLETTLYLQRIAQESAVASAVAAASDAKRQADMLMALGRERLASTNDVQQAIERADEQAVRLAAERARLALLDSAMRRQLVLQRGEAQHARKIAAFHVSRVASMRVAAGGNGIVQTLPLELGQWVLPGQVLATVAQPGQLKAVLRVPEGQARDVVAGQPVEVDTRNGMVQGRVGRVDPTVKNGSVSIDVALDTPLPPGARADLSIDGSIEVERLVDAVHVGRPVLAEGSSSISLFKLTPDGSAAVRVPVRIGRTSATTVQVLHGLLPGDRVIVSDMTDWGGVERVRLK